MLLRMTVLVLLVAAVAVGEPSQGPSKVDLRQMMTAEEFQAAGLTKLSPEEMAFLNQWLDQFATSVRSRPTAEETTPPVIESRIDGEFEGWEGETIFPLTNGQVWQQTEFSFHYHYAFRPQVTIVRTNSGYRMQVEGVRPTIRVRRLR